MSAGRIVAVTGATGFIGSHLLPALERAGFRVRALTTSAARPTTDTVRLASYTDAGALHAALDGAFAVVHLAGRAHVLREEAPDVEAAFRAGNVAPTEALVRAAAERCVERFVLLGSAGAVATSSSAPIDDDTPPAPDTAYGRSKLEAERVAERALAERRCAAHPERPAPVVLRPPLVYGPGMKGNPLRLWALVARGAPIPVGSIDNRRSFVYVGNLVAAIVAALTSQPAPRGTFMFADGEALSTADFARRIARSMGKRARVPAVPAPLLRMIGRIGDLVGPAFPLNGEALDRLTGSCDVRGTRFAAATGFTRPTSLDDALAATSEWFLAQRGSAR